MTDFYLEQVDGDTYLRDGAKVALETRSERIKVAGGDDVTLNVRSTVHGPIMSDAAPTVAEAGDRRRSVGWPNPTAMRCRSAWTALVPGKTADAVFAFDRAQSWDEFRKAASLFAAPSQNLVYADTDGPHRLPVPGSHPDPSVRDARGRSRLLARARLGQPVGLAGLRALCAAPHVLDPEEGFIVTANQAVTASQHAVPHLGVGLRVPRQRIRTLLAGDVQGVRRSDMVQIQGDTRNTFAPGLVEHLLGVQVDDFTAQAQRLLRDWDGSQPADKTRDSASAAYFNAVWKHLLEYTFDELPPDIAPDGGSRWMIVIEQLLKDPQERLGGTTRRRPGVTEGSGEILKRALVDARLDLARKLGKVPATWRWGRLHQLDLEHPVHGRRARCRGSCAGHLQPRAASSSAVATPSSTPILGRGRPRLRRHRRSVHAHGGGPRRLRPVRVGQRNGSVGPRLQPALRRPDRRLGRQ